MSNYKFFQPNAMDKKNKYGDCVVRALAGAKDIEWMEAYLMLEPYSRRFMCPFSSLPLAETKIMFEELGFKYNSIKVTKGSKRPTIKQFAKEHKEGIFIVRVAGHMTCVKNGKYMDTWDSGECSLYGYYELINL